MIELKGQRFSLHTNDTTYCFGVTNRGDIEHIFYGSRVYGDIDALIEKRSVLLVNTLYPIDDVSYSIDSMQFEYSLAHRGDMRKSALTLSSKDGDVFDFAYNGYVIDDFVTSSTPIRGRADNTLTIKLKDEHHNLDLELHYGIYEKTNIITRHVILNNSSPNIIDIRAIASMQLDMNAENKELIKFDGAWGRERQPNTQKIGYGIIEGGSNSGLSSAETNTCFVIKDKNTDNYSGRAYGFNLVYSGSHQFFVEKTPYDGLRIINGISREGFDYKLLPLEKFVTPLSVLSFSNLGLNGISNNFHTFINENVIRTDLEIPVMLNTWEAMYFDINDQKLKNIADCAVELGIEAVIVDDGWFGKRNDDTSSLGDWYVNLEKFSDLKGTADYIRSKGLIFGIWVEPEMISEQSDLYCKHREWALRTIGARDVVGRNQFILDLSLKEVQDYIVESVSSVVTTYGVGYLKWDFNRKFSDVGRGGGTYFYDYTMGLYAIMDRLVAAFPKLIIEGCASGGGRMDIGLLRYCPFIWVSDNTDSLSRAEIQDGTSYGYPLTSMLNHISMSPNHQTKRSSSLETRFNIARFGRLGVQLDITKLSIEERSALALAIAQYKEERKDLINARLYRLHNIDVTNDIIWLAVGKDGTYAKLSIFRKRYYNVSGRIFIRLQGLDKESLYRIVGDNLDVIASGSVLVDGGLVIPQNYQGVGGTKDTTYLLNSTCIVFTIRQINNY